MACARAWAAGLVVAVAFLALPARGAAQGDETAGEGTAVEGAADETPAAAEAAALMPAAATNLGFLAADSEVVFGPTLYGITSADLARGGSRLSQVVETVDGLPMLGPDIVLLVAERYSVGPRVLTALIQTFSGWSVGQGTAASAFDDGASLLDGLEGMADALNGAFYGYQSGAVRELTLADGGKVTIDGVNPGTFAVLAVLAARTDAADWPGLELPSQFYAAWTNLYGEPYYFASSPLHPPDGNPTLALPFGAAQIWYYLAGPHSPAGTQAPWAALDFAPPPATDTGCTPSPIPVTAIAAGTVAESSGAGVFVDLDNDGSLATGWVHVYEHLSLAGRVSTGDSVDEGDVLGYTSCEGGASAPARVSASRRFDGQWIPAADPSAPMLLEGWLPQAGRQAGTGTLVTVGLAPRVPSTRKVDAVNGVAHP